jgi:GNAT superfamily N-acetyltransferase
MIGGPPAWSNKPRNYVCKIVDVEPAEFRSMAAQFARSQDVGPVGSQYEERIRAGTLAGEPEVGLLGIRAEETLLCAMSYGIHTLPRDRGYSARIDLVITRPNCRGRGLGGVVMSAFFRKMFEQHGEKLVHFSVVAQHPAIEHFVVRNGFHRFEGAQAPIFELHVDEALRSALDRKSSALIHSRFDLLAEETSAWWKSDAPPQKTGS